MLSKNIVIDEEEKEKLQAKIEELTQINSNLQVNNNILKNKLKKSSCFIQNMIFSL